MNSSKSFLPVLGALMLMAGGCKPDNLDPYKGTASAMLDGKQWVAVSLAGQLRHDPKRWSLNLKILDPKSGLTTSQLSLDRMGLDNVLGRFLVSVGGPVNSNDSELYARYTMRIFDGDVSSHPWHVMRAGPSQYLEITRYDSVTQEVEGVFSMTLHKYVLGQGFVPDDSVVFTQGTFKTRIKMW